MIQKIKFTIARWLLGDTTLWQVSNATWTHEKGTITISFPAEELKGVIQTGAMTLEPKYPSGFKHVCDVPGCTGTKFEELGDKMVCEYKDWQERVFGSFKQKQ